jgi:hypothetical protein
MSSYDFHIKVDMQSIMMIEISIILSMTIGEEELQLLGLTYERKK